MPGQVQQINLRKIAFPSDHLSVKNLRTLFPELFDGPDESVKFFDVDFELATLLDVERRIARRAFDAVLRKSRDPTRDPFFPEEDAEGLSKLYVRFRIASGEHQAKEMIRAFEREAKEQGQKYGNPSRP